MMKISNLRQIFLVILSIVTLQACASYTDEMQEVQAAYRMGSYEKALTSLQKSGLQEQTKNRLLYLLEHAMLLDRLGQREDSRVLLLKADRVVDELFTRSLSQAAASFLVNDAVENYAGEDYEKVAIHTMLAHSFVEDKLWKEARVEAARINTRLNEINSSYEKEKNRYAEDAYARYLAGIVYEQLEEWDAAIVDYRQALKIYDEQYQKLFQTKAPDHLVQSLYRLLLQRQRKDEAKALRQRFAFIPEKSWRQPDEGELVVLHEVGLIASKERSETLVPLGNEVVRFSFPVIRRVRTSFGRSGVKWDDQPTVYAQLAQNLDKIAQETLEDRRLRILAKSAARLILKSQMTQKAQKEFGALGWLFGNIYGAVTETADTRSWVLLPGAIEITRLPLKAGQYSISILNDGKVNKIETVKIKAGEITLLRDRV